MFEWNSSLTLFFALSENVTILMEDGEVQLHPGGILAVNPFDLYAHEGEGGQLIALEVSQEILRLTNLYSGGKILRCYVKDDSPGKSQEYGLIRTMFADLFQTYFQENLPSSKTTSDVLALLNTLSAHFSTDLHADRRHSEKSQRAKKILDYLYKNWNRDISLIDLSKEIHLSPSYLSHYFSKHFHTTFLKYLMDIRIRNAQRELLNTDQTVTAIAYGCGFKNSSAFIAQFHARTGTTPQEYRRNVAIQAAAPTSAQEPIDLSCLLRYSSAQENPVEDQRIEERQYTIDLQRTGRPLQKPWKKLINIGYARDGLSAAVQSVLRTAQEQIGFQYLRFHGIFDEDMHVYNEDKAGRSVLNFSYVDMLLDFVLSIGLTPYVELSYMPSKLAKIPALLWDRDSIISTCNAPEKWCWLVRCTLEHFIARYGRTSVLQWRFSTIGVRWGALGFGAVEDYFEHYRITYQAVKAVDPGLLFGGPGTYANTIWQDSYLPEFYRFSEQHDCMPDFFSCVCYSHRIVEEDSKSKQLAKTHDETPAILSTDENFTQTFLRDLHPLLKQYYHSDSCPEIWLEEWNVSIWQRDISGDTCFKAAWLAHNLMTNYMGAEAFGYWLLSDFFEEIPIPGQIFHGGYGLMTYNGIPKAGWLALCLMEHLTGNILSGGDGYFITRSQTEIQILLVNYCYYNDFSRYPILTAPESAYQVFANQRSLHFQLRLTGLADGKYRMKKYEISRTSGSSYDNWLALGAPAAPSREELEYLRRTAVPAQTGSILSVCQETVIESTLTPHEVQLITLEKIE